MARTSPACRPTLLLLRCLRFFIIAGNTDFIYYNFSINFGFLHHIYLAIHIYLALYCRCFICDLFCNNICLFVKCIGFRFASKDFCVLTRCVIAQQGYWTRWFLLSTFYIRLFMLYLLR